MQTVAIVPHTHWDREWYAPFQTFRLRLVHLLDRLLPLLEGDASYARFLLDGQTAMIDDYLELRPEAEASLGALVGSGRVSVGPWTVLMDEFMVSGETIVRNLQMGLARAEELRGRPDDRPVGYLPDMFGHIAQMPQLLRLAGIHHAVVWRGVPAAVDRTAFWWEAPDGSRVRAEYLYGSYSNGRDLPDDAKLLVARAASYAAELGRARLPGGDLLLMNGSDHLLPQPWLGRLVAEANDHQGEYRFVVTSLREYLPAQPTDGLSTWRGELRSGARANVLMGVASNRVDVHQACAAAERAIERRAEPLSALLVPPDAYPGRALGIAWRDLVLNSAHDSACACSADEVVDQVLVRYHEARQVGDALTREAVHVLAAEVDAPRGATVVVNPTQWDRGGLVEVVVPGAGPLHLIGLDGERVAAQVVTDPGGDTGDDQDDGDDEDAFSTTVVGAKIRWVLELMRGSGLGGTRIGGATLATTDDGVVEVTCTGVGRDDPASDLGSLHDELLALGDAGSTFRIRVTRSPARRVIFRAAAVPGFGWRTYAVVDGDVVDGETIDVPVTATPGRAGNGLLRYEVDASDGTFFVEADGVRIAGLGRLVDGGDGGDTYNYSPPAEDRVVDHPVAVELAQLETGPVRARTLVTSTYRWPSHAIGGRRSCSRRSDDTVDVDVRTTVELRAGERFLHVHTELDNRCRDHRLRAHFPLLSGVTGSVAECAFAVVERGLSAEGGAHEAPLATFVSRRFVDASDGSVGLALLHDGLLEYEVLDEGREVALTLLRATAYLSRSEPVLRPNPAGPLDPLEGPQMPGRHAVDYAVLPHRGGWADASLHAAADEMLVPLERARAARAGGTRRAPTGRALAVRGAVVSAVARDHEHLLLRAFNPMPDVATLVVTRQDAPAIGHVVDLRGRALDRFSGARALRAGEIVTLRIGERPE